MSFNRKHEKSIDYILQKSPTTLDAPTWTAQPMQPQKVYTNNCNQQVSFYPFLFLLTDFDAQTMGATSCKL